MNNLQKIELKLDEEQKSSNFEIPPITHQEQMNNKLFIPIYMETPY